MNELERLRADLEVVKRLRRQESTFWTMGHAETALTEQVARLEAEAADPWREAKAYFQRQKDREKDPRMLPLSDEAKKALAYVDHLTAENDRLAARVAELEGAAEETLKWIEADEAAGEEPFPVGIMLRSVLNGPHDNEIRSPEPDDINDTNPPKFEIVGTRTVKYADAGPVKPRDVSFEINDVNDDPILDPVRVLATAEIILRAKKWIENANNVSFIWRGIDRNAKPYRLKEGGE